MAEEIKMTLDDKELQDYLQRIEARGRNLKSFFYQTASILHKSILYNFKAGGRPNRWKPLSSWYLAVKRIRKRSSGVGNDMLQLEGKLRSSIGILKLDNQHLEYGPQQSQYAATMQYGRDKKTVRAKGRALAIPVSAVMFREITGNKAGTREPVIFRKQVTMGEIPSRPYILFQNEDVARITSYAAAWAFDDNMPKEPT